MAKGTKDAQYIAADNLRAMFQCYINMVCERSLVPPGIGAALGDYEKRFKAEFNKFLFINGVDAAQVGFKE